MNVAGLYCPPVSHTPPQPPQGWWAYFDQHRDLPMPPQSYNWTCSICATDWVLRATGLNPHSNREQVAGEIGYPDCVNPAVGLADTDCLLNVFETYGARAEREWVDWERAWEICSTTTGVLNSTRWYHFVAIRGVGSQTLWIANSAEGYMGIWDSISRAQFEAWAGSWQAVFLVP